MPSVENIFGLEGSQELSQEAVDRHVQNNEFQTALNQTVSKSKMELDVNTSMMDMARTLVDTTGKMCSGAFTNSTQTLAQGYR